MEKDKLAKRREVSGRVSANSQFNQQNKIYPKPDLREPHRIKNYQESFEQLALELALTQDYDIIDEEESGRAEKNQQRELVPEEASDNNHNHNNTNHNSNVPVDLEAVKGQKALQGIMSKYIVEQLREMFDSQKEKKLAKRKGFNLPREPQLSERKISFKNYSEISTVVKPKLIEDEQNLTPASMLSPNKQLGFKKPKFKRMIRHRASGSGSMRMFASSSRRKLIKQNQKAIATPKK